MSTRPYVGLEKENICPEVGDITSAGVIVGFTEDGRVKTDRMKGMSFFVDEIKLLARPAKGCSLLR